MRRLCLLWLPLLVCDALLACDAKPEPAKAPKPSEGVALGRKAPLPDAAYAPPEAWRSSRDETLVVSPPDAAKETWRAFVNQHTPNQRLTPKWQPLSAKKTVELAMPEGSRFRCAVLPLQTAAIANDFNTKLIAWSLKRELLCSADDWQTWSSSTHETRMTPEGERSSWQAALHLRERRDDGKTYETVVLIRDDAEQRKASTGPPQIVEGRLVDED